MRVSTSVPGQACQEDRPAVPRSVGKSPEVQQDTSGNRNAGLPGWQRLTLIVHKCISLACRPQSARSSQSWLAPAALLPWRDAVPHRCPVYKVFLRCAAARQCARALRLQGGVRSKCAVHALRSLRAGAAAPGLWEGRSAAQAHAAPVPLPKGVPSGMAGPAPDTSRSNGRRPGRRRPRTPT